MSTLTLAQAESALAVSPVAVPRTFDVLRLEGPDTDTYLQGQISQDVSNLSEGDTAWTFLLQPQGKVEVWGRIHRHRSGQRWLVVDEGFGDLALARLERFKLRVDTSIELTSLSGLRVVVPAADIDLDALDASGAEHIALPGLSPLDHAALAGSAVIVDLLGIDDLPGATAGPNELDTVLRCLLGLPSMGAELDESTIPAAARVVNRSTSFTKGCYVGQELVARIDARGQNTPTRLCRLSAPGGEPLVPGTELAGPEGVAARVTSAVVSPTFGSLGLGYVNRSVETGTELADPSGAPVEFVEVLDEV